MSLLNNRDHENRPWGSFDRFTLNEISTVKIMRLNSGEQLSLQTHTKRSEFWYVLSGSGEVTIGTEILQATIGGEFSIPTHTPHRAKASAEGLVFLEVALGEFVEHDEERLEDVYGRGSPTT